MHKGMIIGGLLGVFGVVANNSIEINDAYAGLVKELDVQPSAQCAGAPDCQISDVTMLLKDQNSKELSLTLAMVGQQLEVDDMVVVGYTQSPVQYAMEKVGIEAHKDIWGVEIYTAE